ncbi:MAG: DUF547 domain-containing protein [Rhodothermales bacterium]|nr:DUF547 domain-containing protein [Rhodothermales bacterium]
MRLHVFLSFISLLVTHPILAQTASQEPFYDSVDALLGKHVRAGRVDYAAIKKEPAALDALLKSIAETDRAALAPADDKAFLVNAYNILVIKTVVDRLPLASPLDDAGFFNEAAYPVAGATLTLDNLEKKTLYVAYPDARLHFALVCAARGCPELIPEAYRGATLDEQLDRQTRHAMTSPQLVRYDAGARTARLSELFTWYVSDFTRNHPSVLAFINAYRATPIPESTTVTTLSYDWTLND